MIIAGLLLAVTAVFTPPRLISGDPPPLPPPTVVGGGEVLVEAIIDADGNVSQAILVRSTPPYSQMLLDAVSGWRFEPARAVDDNGVNKKVEGAVLIAAVYRGPTVLNGPTVGTAPLDLVPAPAAVAYPVTMVTPVYPVGAASFGVVMLEVPLEESGISRTPAVIYSNPAFDAVAQDAVSRWKFRGAARLSKAIPSNVYVVLGFPIPVVNAARPK